MLTFPALWIASSRPCVQRDSVQQSAPLGRTGASAMRRDLARRMAVYSRTSLLTAVTAALNDRARGRRSRVPRFVSSFNSGRYWLFWFAWTLEHALCRPSHFQTAPRLLRLAYAGGCGFAARRSCTDGHRDHRLSPAFAGLMPIAGIAGIVATTGCRLAGASTVGAVYRTCAVAECAGHSIPASCSRAIGIVAACSAGFAVQQTVSTGRLTRDARRSDNFGHADWLAIRLASSLSDGPGGIVVGEACRVDQDRMATVP